MLSCVTSRDAWAGTILRMSCHRARFVAGAKAWYASEATRCGNIDHRRFRSSCSHILTEAGNALLFGHSSRCSHCFHAHPARSDIRMLRHFHHHGQLQGWMLIPGALDGNQQQKRRILSDTHCRGRQVNTSAGSSVVLVNCADLGAVACQ